MPRLTQRLISALTAPTKSGRLYEVDMRLRPSGRKGPLATQFASFKLYQEDEAETWEHMALTRAASSPATRASGPILRRRCADADPQARRRQDRAGNARDAGADRQEKGDATSGT